MVHGSIERHNGTIEVESTLGEGTTFTIRLPLQKKKASEASRVKDLPQPAHQLHVLVVDDAPSVREVVSAYLMSDEHTCEPATNGREALEKFQSGQFDLVVTDRAMPEMNGDQLASAIKQDSPNTPVILLTGFGDLMEAASEKPTDVDIVLSKPPTLIAFRQALARVVERQG